MEAQGADLIGGSKALNPVSTAGPSQGALSVTRSCAKPRVSLRIRRAIANHSGEDDPLGDRRGRWAKRQDEQHDFHEQDGRNQAVSDSRHERRRRPADHHLAAELREIARLALPMMLTQLARFTMMTTNLVFIGRVGTEALAASALASRVRPSSSFGPSSRVIPQRKL